MVTARSNCSRLGVEPRSHRVEAKWNHGCNYRISRCVYLDLGRRCSDDRYIECTADPNTVRQFPRTSPTCSCSRGDSPSLRDPSYRARRTASADSRSPAAQKTNVRACEPKIDGHYGERNPRANTLSHPSHVTSLSVGLSAAEVTAMPGCRVHQI